MMKKRGFALLLVLALFLTSLPVIQAAGTDAASGTCGTNLTWTLSQEGVLRISGTGSMINYDPYSSEHAPWYSYRNSIYSVVIEPGVTTIGDLAFQDCRDITAVELPSGVTTIGYKAFQNCSGLAAVTLPASVTTIGKYAFSGCSRLSALTLTQGLTTIGDYAFYECGSLTTVVIPSTVTAIGDSAFSHCQNLTAVTIPFGVTTIGYSAFELCTSLTVVDLPVSLTSLGSGAFSSCSGLTTVKLPASLTSIDSNTFSDCSSLTAVVLPSSLRDIGMRAFYHCSNLKKVYYTGTADQWNQIAMGVDNACLTGAPITYISSAEDVCIITKGAMVGQGTFAVPTGTVLKGETITVTDIQPAKDYVFQAVTVDGTPISGTSFQAAGDHTVSVIFEPRETDVIAHGTCGPNLTWTLNQEGVLRIRGTGEMTAVPWTDYKSTIRTVILESGVTTIGEGAFEGCSNLTSVEIPAGVTSIGGLAFYKCSSLTAVTIPAGVASIGISTFYECSNLTAVTIPEGVTSIGSWAFYACSSLTAVTLPTSLTAIADYAFCDCSSLTAVTIPEGVTSIGNSAFEGCSGLNTFSIPSSVASVSGSCFHACTSLTEILAAPGNTVYCSKDGVLYSKDQTHLIRFPEGKQGTCVLPAALNAIDVGAFHLCTQLEKVFYTGTQEQWSQVTIGADNEHLTRLPISYISSEEEICTITKGAPTGEGTFEISERSVAKGETVNVTNIRPARAYLFQTVTVDGTPISGTSFQATGNHTVSVVFEALGEDCVDSGTCGPNLNWVLNRDGVLRIRGTGEMKNYTDRVPLYRHHDAIRTVILEPGVTTIGNSAFDGCSNLTSVTIPESISAIGRYAFEGCSSLRSVVFPGDAPELGDAAFPSTDPRAFIIYYHAGTTGWTSPTWKGYCCICLDAPSEYSTLDAENRNSQHLIFTLNADSKTAVVGENSGFADNAGYLGTGSGHVVIPETVTKDGVSYEVVGIAGKAFAHNTHLKSIHLGASLSSLGQDAFLYCTNLTEFTVAAESRHYSARDGVLYDWGKTYLYAYPGGKADAAFIIPETVTIVGTGAFRSNARIKSLVVPDTVQNILRGAFTNCDSLESLTVPFIGGNLTDSSTLDYVCEYGPALKTLVVTGQGRLKPKAFSGHYTLEQIQLPTCGTEIPREAFAGCTRLHSLKFADKRFPAEPGMVCIPGDVSKIGDRAFARCDAITGFYVDGGNLNYCADQWGILFDKAMTTLIQYPAARSWPYYNVPDSVTALGDYAFHHCKNLVNLYIPRTVAGFPELSISGCPDATFCVWQDSQARIYAGQQGLRTFLMENFQLQGIQIEGLPENAVLVMGQEDLSGMQVTMFGGVSLPVENYDLSYSSDQPGPQKLIVSYQGQTATASVVRYDPKTEIALVAQGLTARDGEQVFIAAYDADGRMLFNRTAFVAKGSAQVFVSRNDYAPIATAKAFCIKDGTNAPVSAAVDIQVRH